MQTTRVPRASLTSGRRSLNLTQRQAAELYGKVTRETVSNWEKGEGGYSDASKVSLGDYCDWLREQAIARKIDPAVFERCVLCPVEFPQERPDLVRGAA